MFYNEKTTHKADKSPLIERRHKITIEQDEAISDLTNRLKIPASAVIRMALDSFIPKTKNCGFTEQGIRAGYLNGNYR